MTPFDITLSTSSRGPSELTAFSVLTVIRTLTDDDMAEDSFRWSLSLMSRVLVRVVGEGSTIVMKAINQNSGKQLKKAVGCAPRGKRALWMLDVRVGTQTISPLLWAIETGSMEAANAILVDLLTFRADRDRYYYGMDTLFERHPDVIKRLCIDAPALLPVLLDGLIWRSRTTERGMRRVNYYVKHLLVDAHGAFSKTIEWVTETKDPKLVCHSVLSLVTDMVWGRVAMRSFLLGKIWFLFTLAIFILSQAVLKREGSDVNNPRAEASQVIRIIVCACRVFIYVFSLGHGLLKHTKNILTNIRESSYFKFGFLKIPSSYLQWQETSALLLTIMLLCMLCLEPILHCLESEAEVFLADNCLEAHPREELRPGDRLVAVNGMRGGASELLQKLAETRQSSAPVALCASRPAGLDALRLGEKAAPGAGSSNASTSSGSARSSARSGSTWSGSGATGSRAKAGLSLRMPSSGASRGQSRSPFSGL